ncbi:MAG: methionine--tRNA ligase, partial [Actinobacteria bacterium]|nr:methionine--tRNA ligase [Actinomycetota bacterium]
MTVKKFSATTPIYYVNAKPHLGHAYTTIVADAVCRWHKLCGDDVHLLTGTDEHGLKIQQFADAEGISPKQFVDKIAPLFADAWQRLNIDVSDFIRTTEERHKIGVQKLLQACYDAGDIEVDTYRGHYCVACEAYYTPEELDNDKCKIHNTKAEYVEEENYFFRLSRYEEKLLKWYADHPDAIKPDHRVNEVTGFIKQGLRDFSVSRKTLTWGIELPWDKSHVAYVWFDALANYITAHGYGTDDKQFATKWPVDYHFIGKDIIRFHCVYWPAMLMSAGLEPPKGWAVGGWLLVGGEKMSKTTGNVVNPLDLIDEIGVDGFRYYVLSDTNYGNDGDFSYEGLLSRYNSDLANNFGNLAARVATVV